LQKLTSITKDGQPIDAWQVRHLPRATSQLMIGNSSNHLSVSTAVRTIDRPAKKLPNFLIAITKCGGSRACHRTDYAPIII